LWSLAQPEIDIALFSDFKCSLDLEVFNTHDDRLPCAPSRCERKYAQVTPAKSIEAASDH
jgi:hypothetical protein